MRTPMLPRKGSNYSRSFVRERWGRTAAKPCGWGWAAGGEGGRGGFCEFGEH